ncbi:FAD-dependent oxidoreductase [Richelia sinica]|nr:NAD(P)/FAD-dependent oxidoreductase [Richelia sinica]
MSNFNTNSMKKVAIIGAGPSGVLLAHYLLRRNDQYQIDIYERRSDPRNIAFSKVRSFPISLGDRGMSPIAQIPGLVTAVKAVSIEKVGTIIHQKNGKTKVTNRQKPLVTLDRTHLATVLLEKLLETHNQHINIHFNTQLIAVDFAAKKAKLQKISTSVNTEVEAEFTIDYDLLIGADGARSVVREYLSNTPDFEFEQNYVLNAYKSIFLPKPDPIPDVNLEKNKIHTWRLTGGISVLMLYQLDGAMSGVILFPYANNPIAKLTTVDEVLTFFRDNFPEISKLMPVSEAEEFLKRPISRVLTVRCNRYHYQDSVLLLGDAAHAVSPSIGQGCNSALEDVFIFNQLLDEYGDNLAIALENYSLRRHPDGMAVRELSDYSFPVSKKLFFEFLLLNTWTKLLHNIFPQRCLPPIFEAVFQDNLSYKEILDYYQNWISKVKASNIKFYANVENNKQSNSGE